MSFSISPAFGRGGAVNRAPTNVGTNGYALITNGAGVTSWGAVGQGSVTSVSVTTANGVSGSVANSSTTPAITITLGAITPSSITMGGGAVTGLPTATNPSDAVPFSQMQSAIATGVHTFLEVEAFSSTNVDKTTPGAITDGSYSVASGDTILLTGQSTGSENGPWVYNGAASALTRPLDYAAGSTQEGGIVYYVTGVGSSKQYWSYVLNTNPVTVDTTSTTWGTFQAAISGTYPIVVSGGAISLTTGISGNTVPFLDGTNTWSGPQTIQRDNLVATQSPAIILQNTTATTSGVTSQFSPYLSFIGRHWSGSADAYTDWRIYNVPSGGSGGSTLTFSSGYNGSIPAARMQLTHAGALSLDGSITAGAATFSGHVIPSATITYNLGAYANRWNTVHTGGIQFGTSSNVTAISNHGSGVLFYANSAIPLKITNTEVRLLSSAALVWSDGVSYGGTSDLILGRNAAANLRLGAADAASPVAQTLSVQSVVVNTSNTSGTLWTFKDSAGTGTGDSGGYAWQTATAGSTGSTQNSFTTKMSLSSAGVLNVGGVVSIYSGGTYAAVTSVGANGLWFTGTGGIGVKAGNHYGMGSSNQIQWTGTSNNFYNATVDTGVGRNAAGVVEVNNGTLGTYRDVKLRNLIIDGASATGGTTVTTGIEMQSSTQMYININGTIACKIQATGFRANAGVLYVGGSGAEATLTKKALNGLQFGDIDASSPAAQTLSFQSVIAGTSNTAGANATIKASAGSGNANGGSLIVQVAPAGSSGTSQNTFVDALTIDSTKLATFAGAIVATGGMSSTRVNPRVVAATDSTTWAPAGDTSDINSQTNTQTAGALTVSAPTGTPVDGQRMILRIKSTNVQTFSFNAIYRASTDTALPTASTGGGKWDYLVFLYNSADTKWDYVGQNFGH